MSYKRIRSSRQVCIGKHQYDPGTVEPSNWLVPLYGDKSLREFSQRDLQSCRFKGIYGSEKGEKLLRVDMVVPTGVLCSWCIGHPLDNVELKTDDERVADVQKMLGDVKSITQNLALATSTYINFINDASTYISNTFVDSITKTSDPFKMLMDDEKKYTSLVGVLNTVNGDILKLRKMLTDANSELKLIPTTHSNRRMLDSEYNNLQATATSQINSFTSTTSNLHEKRTKNAKYFQSTIIQPYILQKKNTLNLANKLIDNLNTHVKNMDEIFKFLDEKSTAITHETDNTKINGIKFELQNFDASKYVAAKSEYECIVQYNADVTSLQTTIAPQLLIDLQYEPYISHELKQQLQTCVASITNIDFDKTVNKLIVLIKDKRDIIIDKPGLSATELSLKQSIDEQIDDVSTGVTEFNESLKQKGSTHNIQQAKDAIAAAGIHPSDIVTAYDTEYNKIEQIIDEINAINTTHWTTYNLIEPRINRAPPNVQQYYTEPTCQYLTVGANIDEQKQAQKEALSKFTAMISELKDALNARVDIYVTTTTSEISKMNLNELYKTAKDAIVPPESLQTYASNNLIPDDDRKEEIEKHRANARGHISKLTETKQGYIVRLNEIKDDINTGGSYFTTHEDLSKSVSLKIDELKGVNTNELPEQLNEKIRLLLQSVTDHKYSDKLSQDTIFDSLKTQISNLKEYIKTTTETVTNIVEANAEQPSLESIMDDKSKTLNDKWIAVNQRILYFRSAKTSLPTSESVNNEVSAFLTLIKPTDDRLNPTTKSTQAYTDLGVSTLSTISDSLKTSIYNENTNIDVNVSSGSLKLGELIATIIESINKVDFSVDISGDLNSKYESVKDQTMDVTVKDDTKQSAISLYQNDILGKINVLKAQVGILNGLLDNSKELIKVNPVYFDDHKDLPGLISVKIEEFKQQRSRVNDYTRTLNQNVEQLEDNAKNHMYDFTKTQEYILKELTSAVSDLESQINVEILKWNSFKEDTKEVNFNFNIDEKWTYYEWFMKTDEFLNEFTAHKETLDEIDTSAINDLVSNVNDINLKISQETRETQEYKDLHIDGTISSATQLEKNINAAKEQYREAVDVLQVKIGTKFKDAEKKYAVLSPKMESLVENLEGNLNDYEKFVGNEDDLNSVQKLYNLQESDIVSAMEQFQKTADDLVGQFEQNSRDADDTHQLLKDIVDAFGFMAAGESPEIRDDAQQKLDKLESQRKKQVVSEVKYQRLNDAVFDQFSALGRENHVNLLLKKMSEPSPSSSTSSSVNSSVVSHTESDSESDTINPGTISSSPPATPPPTTTDVSVSSAMKSTGKIKSSANKNITSPNSAYNNNAPVEMDDIINSYIIGNFVSNKGIIHLDVSNHKLIASNFDDIKGPTLFIFDINMDDGSSIQGTYSYDFGVSDSTDEDGGIIISLINWTTLQPRDASLWYNHKHCVVIRHDDDNLQFIQFSNFIIMPQLTLHESFIPKTYNNSEFKWNKSVGVRIENTNTYKPADVEMTIYSYWKVLLEKVSVENVCMVDSNSKTNKYALYNSMKYDTLAQAITEYKRKNTGVDNSKIQLFYSKYIPTRKKIEFAKIDGFSSTLGI